MVLFLRKPLLAVVEGSRKNRTMDFYPKWKTFKKAIQKAGTSDFRMQPEDFADFVDVIDQVDLTSWAIQDLDFGKKIEEMVNRNVRNLTDTFNSAENEA